ncbi:MAG: hypothetical protein WDN06_08195 [Asticcacaulis sp.]
MSGIEIRNVSKAFGQTVVLDDISLSIADDEFVAFLGAVRLRQDHAPAHHRRAGAARFR